MFKAPFRRSMISAISKGFSFNASSVISFRRIEDKKLFFSVDESNAVHCASASALAPYVEASLKRKQ
jgi:hypothetical protein